MDYQGLKGIVPDPVYDRIPTLVSDYGCNTKLRLAHFLAQCAHESNGFKATVENLNYSEKGLLQTFKKYFTPSTARDYARKPEAIANTVYANRMGNGPVSSGDGFRFRGRGYIQLTGKDNYARFSKFAKVDVVANPDLVATEYPLDSAAFYFNENALWSVCDKGDTADVVALVTKRVNGGTIGLKHRIDMFCLYSKYIG